MDNLPPVCLELERATPADEDNADDDDRGSDEGRGLQAHLLDDVAALMEISFVMKDGVVYKR